MRRFAKRKGDLHPNEAFDKYKSWKISLKVFKEKTKWYSKPTIDSLDRMKEILANPWIIDII